METAIGPFTPPILPDEFFLNHAGDRLGRFKGEDFHPYEPDEGAVVANYPHERPFILRVTGQVGNQIWTVDGTGAEFVYDISPITD